MYRYTLLPQNIKYDLSLSMLQGIYSYVAITKEMNRLPSNLPQLISNVPLNILSTNTYTTPLRNPFTYIIITDPYGRSAPGNPSIRLSSRDYDEYMISISGDKDKFKGITILTDNLLEYLEGILLAEFLLNEQQLNDSVVLDQYEYTRLYYKGQYLPISRLNGFPILALPIGLINNIIRYSSCDWLLVSKEFNNITNPIKYTDPILDKPEVNQVALDRVEYELRTEDQSNIISIINGVKAGKLKIAKFSEYIDNEELISVIIDKLMQDIGILNIVTDDSIVDKASEKFIDYLLQIFVPYIPILSDDQRTLIEQSAIMVDLLDRNIMRYKEWNTIRITILIRNISSNRLIKLTTIAMEHPERLSVSSSSSFLDILFNVHLRDNNALMIVKNHMEFIRWLYSVLDNQYINYIEDLVELYDGLKIHGDLEFIYTSTTKLLQYNLSVENLELLRGIIDFGISSYGFSYKRFEQLYVELLKRTMNKRNTIMRT